DGTTGLPMPTVVIVDGTGVIRWIDVHPNCTTRTEASDILAALQPCPDPSGGPAVAQHMRGTAPPPHTSSPSATQRVNHVAISDPKSKYSSMS
ncbi:MAG TPA: hypothetical protein VFN75_00300, partial [Pseudonocardiaceae bacterium]|nr:hypothetical protein [Pseudonocardiaceae bacterium]